MKIAGIPYRSIWVTTAGVVRVIDQRCLPFELATLDLVTLEDAADAIRDMAVRGAPLIGAAAAYGVALALRGDASDEALAHAERTLLATRPTAVNLAWALDRMHTALAGVGSAARVATALREAARICDLDVATCHAIGRHGLEIDPRRHSSLRRVNRRGGGLSLPPAASRTNARRDRGRTVARDAVDGIVDCYWKSGSIESRMKYSS